MKTKSEPLAPSRPIPPPWLLGVTNAPLGLLNGFAVVTLPQMLAAQGLSGGQIAVMVALIISPGFWNFLIAPILDVRFSRRSYALAFLLYTTAACAYTVLHHSNPAVVEAVMLSAYVSGMLYASAVGGWTGSLISHGQDTSLGMWFNVFNTGAAGLTILLGGEMVHTWRPALSAVILVTTLLLPLVSFLFIPSPGPDRTLASESFGRFWREVAALLRRREVLWALALFLLPSASFSLTNVLGGVGKDFSASVQLVSFSAGLGSVLAGLGGSFLLKPLARKLPLRPLYLSVGIVGAVFTLSLLLLPRHPWTFAFAFTGENVFQALAFATGFAIIFEVIGQGNPLAATTFALLVAAMNVPVDYMGVLDGHAYDWKGLTGSFIADAGVSMAACLALLWAFRAFRGRNVRVQQA